jgi:hypothetical protein
MIVSLRHWAPVRQVKLGIHWVMPKVKVFVSNPLRSWEKMLAHQVDLSVGTVESYLRSRTQ